MFLLIVNYQVQNGAGDDWEEKVKHYKCDSFGQNKKVLWGRLFILVILGES